MIPKPPVWTLTLTLILSALLTVRAQECAFDLCASDDCGSMNVKFVPEGGPVFCDGEEIVFQNISDTGFTFFVVDWRDGQVDTLYDYSDFVHIYHLPDSLLCQGGDVVFYSVCFMGVRECPAGTTCQSGTYAFGIRKKPKALFGSGNVCHGQAFEFVNLSCHAKTAQWEFGDGNGSWEEEPSHTYDSLGDYTVRLIVTNECGADTVYGGVTVVLNPEAGITRQYGFKTWCDSLPVEELFTNTSNAYSLYGQWTIWPADSTKWKFTDTLMHAYSKSIRIAFLDTGTFIIQLRAWNDCGESFRRDTIRILTPPVAGIYPPVPRCDSVMVTPLSLGFHFEGPVDSCLWIFGHHDGPDTLKGFSFPPEKFDSSGNVRLLVIGPCGILDYEVPVIVWHTPPVDFSATPPRICRDGGPVPLTASPPGGVWQGLGQAAGAVTPEGILDPSGLNPGHYLIYYAQDSLVCPTDATISIEILPTPTVFVNPPSPACGHLSYAPDVVYTGEIQTWQWYFPGANPPSSTKSHPTFIWYGLPGTYKAYVTATGTCGTVSDSVVIQIQPPLNLFIYPAPPPICTHSDPFLLTANIPGGTWYGPGIIDPATGLFDPGAVPGGQPVQIFYAHESGVCKDTANASIEVNIPEPVQVADSFFCLNDPAALLFADIPGGTWSGPGIVHPGFGLFFPAGAGLGTWEVVYTRTDANGCVAADSALMTVEPVPVLSVADTTLICFVPQSIDLAEATGFAADPAGGITTWSGPGVDPLTGILNPVQAGLSTGSYLYTVRYSRNGCEVEATAVITLIHATPLSLPPDAVACISEEMLTLTATPAGGQWSGPGIDPFSGVVNLSLAGHGQHGYTYEKDPGTSCAQSGTVEITVIDPAKDADPGPDIVLCEEQGTLTLDGFSPSGGLWSGPGLTDPVAGTVDLNVLVPDSTYTYLYCLTDAQYPGCQACVPRQVTLHPRPSIHFGMKGYPCVDALFTLLDSSVHADTYLWDFGDGTTSTDASPGHLYTQEGPVSITLIVTSPFGCRDTMQQDYFVTHPPVAAFAVPAAEGCAPFPIEVTNQSTGYGITELWIFGTDTVFASQPGILWVDGLLQDTLIRIRLEVSNTCGTAVWEEDVVVHPVPVVDFGFDVAEGCSPLTIQFANNSAGNPEHFFWDLGNGTTTNAFLPPAQVYTTPDSAVTQYPVTLISTNFCGSDTLTQMVTVYPPDVEAFIGLEAPEGCQPLAISPQDFSTPGSAVSWQVYNEEDSLLYASVAGSPTFLLEEPGWHTIILYASRCGTDTDTARVFVHPSPEVGFTSLPYACEGSEVTFTNLTTASAGQLWDFGDGTQSDAISPVHVFTGPGVYTVTLTGYSTFHLCPKTVTQTIEILPAPDVDIQPSAWQGCGPLEVQFQPGAQGALQFVWTFGDGSSASFEPSPVHVFDTAGAFVVTLTATDSIGCTSSPEQVVIQVYPSPSGQISSPADPLCTGAGPFVWTSSHNDAVTWQWTVDGQMYTTQSVTWWPGGSGFVDIALVVSNIYQCRDTVVSMYEVFDAPRALAEAGVVSGCEDLRVPFINYSQHADYFHWTFGDQTSSVESAPTHVYTEPGVWMARLVASSANGCPPDTAEMTIVVHPTPEADFSMVKDRECGLPQTVQLTNLTTDADAWMWTFDGGQQTPVAHPAHVFTSAGMHEIQLVASNIYHCRDTVLQQLEIRDQPVADFDAVVLTGCQPLTVPLINLTSGALQYEWWVNGMVYSEEAAPVLVLTDTGQYDVRLVAHYGDYCHDTLEIPSWIRVYQSPVAGFTWVADESENVIGDVRFTNSSADANRYFWDLGDGTTTTEVHVEHAYTQNRDIRVVLYAYQDNGGLHTCVDSVVQWIDPEWITTFYAPNAMSPGYGEEGVRVFRPVGIGIEEYEIMVYSPWGELVWASTALEDYRPSGAWDGTYRGEDVPQGAYAWVARMRFVNGTTRVVKGTVTVLR